MASARVPVDLFNPGQVFACYGLLEAADTLLGNARGGFDWSDPSQSWFHLSAAGDADPVKAVLQFLAEAEVRQVAPQEASVISEATSEVEQVPPGHPFPSEMPTSVAALPVALYSDRHGIVVDHWCDSTRRDSVKFWAGRVIGSQVILDALELVRDRIPYAAPDPFALSAPQSSSFRFDWRRDYVPLGIGFSLNNHQAMTPLGYPLVEVLAAVGLTHARPERCNKFVYRYHVIAGENHSPMLLRASLGSSALPFPSRTFRVQLDEPGKHQRCITATTEET